MADLDFTEEEILEQLSILGYTNIPAHRLREFKQDLDKLIQQGEWKHGADAVRAHQASLQSSPPAFTVQKVSQRQSKKVDDGFYLHSSKRDHEHQMPPHHETRDSYARHSVARKLQPPRGAAATTVRQQVAPDPDETFHPSPTRSSSPVNIGLRFIKRKVLRKHEGQSLICDESFYSEDFGQLVAVVMYKMYNPQFDDASDSKADSLDSSFWSDGEKEEEEEEKVEMERGVKDEGPTVVTDKKEHGRDEGMKPVDEEEEEGDSESEEETSERRNQESYSADSSGDGSEEEEEEEEEEEVKQSAGEDTSQPGPETEEEKAEVKKQQSFTGGSEEEEEEEEEADDDDDDDETGRESKLAVKEKSKLVPATEKNPEVKNQENFTTGSSEGGSDEEEEEEEESELYEDESEREDSSSEDENLEVKRRRSRRRSCSDEEESRLVPEVEDFLQQVSEEEEKQESVSPEDGGGEEEELKSRPVPEAEDLENQEPVGASPEDGGGEEEEENEEGEVESERVVPGDQDFFQEASVKGEEQNPEENQDPVGGEGSKGGSEEEDDEEETSSGESAGDEEDQDQDQDACTSPDPSLITSGYSTFRLEEHEREDQDSRGDLSETRDHQDSGGDLSETREDQDCEGDLSETRDHQDSGGELSETRDHQDCEGDLSKTRDHQDCEGDLSESMDHQDCEGDLSETRDHQDCEGDLSETRDHQDSGGDLSETREDQDYEGDLSETRDQEDCEGELLDTEDSGGDPSETREDQDCEDFSETRDNKDDEDDGHQEVNFGHLKSEEETDERTEGRRQLDRVSANEDSFLSDDMFSDPGSDDEDEREDESSSNKDVKFMDSKVDFSWMTYQHIEWEGNLRRKQDGASVLEEGLADLQVSPPNQFGREDGVEQEEEQEDEEEDVSGGSDAHSSVEGGERTSVSAFDSYMRLMAQTSSGLDPRPKPSKSFIRPVMNQHMKKTDPVAKYFQYKQFWETFKVPGERDRRDLRWEIKERLAYEAPLKPGRVKVPNSYVAPPEKKRLALRWAVRNDLAHKHFPYKVNHPS